MPIPPATPLRNNSGPTLSPDASGKKRPSTTHNTPVRWSDRQFPNRASLDIGNTKDSGFANDLRSKVLRWQSTSNEEHTSPSTANCAKDADDAQEDTTRNTSNSGAAANKNGAAVNVDRHEASPVLTPNGNADVFDIEKDIRAASAPKKRIISDEHWKTDRISPNVSPQGAVPSKHKAAEGTRSPSGKKADAWVRRKSQGGKFGLNEVKTGLVSTQELRQSTSTPQAANIQTHQINKLKKTNPEQKIPEPDNGSSLDLNPGSDRHVLSNTDIKTSSSRSSPAPVAQGDRLGNTNRLSPETSRRTTPIQAEATTKSPGNSVRGGAKQNDQPEDRSTTPPRVFNTRIEAWLGSTPDPFIEKPSRLAKYTITPPSIRDWGSSVTSSFYADHRRTNERALNNASPVTRSNNRSPADERYSSNYKSNKSPLVSSPTDSTSTLKRSGAHRQHAYHEASDEQKSASPTKRDLISLNQTSCIDDSDFAFAPRSHSKTPVNTTTNDPVAPKTLVLASGPTTGQQDTTTLTKPPFTFKEPIGGVPAHPNNPSNKPKRPALNRTTTSHADLISVLSMPIERKETIRSACSIRTNRVTLEGATADDLMQELKSDEAKYLRELRTLVDGVVPVLLTCVLSRSDSVKAAGLFSSSKSGASVTGPIVNMGVALERLKSVHKRIPISSPAALLIWAQGAHRVYVDYIKAWRMGFQDVVVNLAPADEAVPAYSAEKAKSGWDDGLERNHDGYVVGDGGEKVDVSFLLKRPLVRLKYLARTLKGIQALQSSEPAETLANRYQELVKDARIKQAEERARLEDEAAASIDSTRARDLSSLAPLQGVEIEPDCSVKARDYFDLRLQHSTGQKVDCQIEIILRDGKTSSESGNILVCEVDATSRWLFFPPIESSLVSARHGESNEEIVVMIRGEDSKGRDWHELLTLKANEQNTASEWVQLLGQVPLPPLPDQDQSSQEVRQGVAKLTLENLNATANKSASDLELPMGEQASVISQRWEAKKGGPRRNNALNKARNERMADWVAPPGSQSIDRPMSMQDTFKKDQNSIQSDSVPSTPTRSYQQTNSPNTDVLESNVSTSLSHLRECNDYNVLLPDRTTDVKASHVLPEDGKQKHSERPGMHWRTVSLPPKDSPAIPKTRDDQASARVNSGPGSVPYEQKTEGRSIKTPINASPQSPSQARSKNLEEARSLPQTPKSSPIANDRVKPVPDFSPPSTGRLKGRRSSSPLKHEYAPSDSVGSSVAGDMLSDDEVSVTSESSIDEDTIGPLPPRHALKLPEQDRSLNVKHTPRKDQTLAPSDSASQAPYRTVPQQSDESAQIRQIAAIFCWSDKGLWERLHPDECSIVVSPGLIEAFEMTAAHSQDQRLEPIRPLVALELTPLVPIRKGTAIDISIRSPPTSNSQLKTGNNIMFRSRNNQECEVLYTLINQARINNPTYIALQNARGPGNSNWAAAMDRRATARGAPSSWWKLGSKKSSYRAGSTRRTPSIAMESESSVASMSSAISALKRLSANSKLFNVAKSTITSRKGPTSSRSRAVSSTSMNSTSEASGESAPMRIDPTQGTPAGITNVKIRLYERETASKWRDMGPARLTIMHPPRAPGGIVTSAKVEKRIVATGKTKGETLLDATLGESSFERVARTGIAVSIWDYAGEVGKTGGVSTTKIRVFMIQMGSEAEAAFTFSLVGKLRY